MFRGPRALSSLRPRGTLVSKTRNTPTHRTFVHETKPKANPPPTSGGSECRAPGCELLPFFETDDAIRGVNLQVVLGLSCGFLFLRRERTFHHQARRSTTVDNVQSVVCLYGRVGLRRVALENVLFMHVCVRPFHLVELVVEFPRFDTRHKIYANPSSRESWDPCHAKSLSV